LVTNKTSFPRVVTVMDDLAAFCCQNDGCPDFGQRGLDNLTVTARYGPDRRRMLRCRTCTARFSERKGTPLFDSRLPAATAVSVLAHIAEGVGVRKTSRLVGVHRDTVTRFSARAGGHAQQLHDELAALSPPNPRSPVRRKVGLRRQEGEALRPRRPRR
jgi:transposase-like protein